MQSCSSSQNQQKEDLILLTTLIIVGLHMFQSGGQANGPETKIVTASWYDLNGRKMANGEIFDADNKHLAAHKTLPFGTRMELTNPDNNRRLTVTISDRGPFVKKRDLDVSRAAAEYLGFAEKGVTKIKARIITSG